MTDVKDAADRIYKYRNRPRHIFVFSDFDPSGECISMDFAFRLQKCLVMLGEDPTTYTEKPKKIEIPNMQIEKVALTIEQVERHRLPPKFVKAPDPRATGFIHKYGKKAVVELDAMPPSILEKIILDTVTPYLDMEEVQRNREMELKIKTEGPKALRDLACLEESDNIGEDRCV